MFLTTEAIRLALEGGAVATACTGCPPVERLFQQFADGGGELLVCPICFNARNSRRTCSSQTPASPARRGSGSGSAKTRSCSATDA
jgi:hypothetical protein